MTLQDRLSLAESCDLEEVGEAILNVRMHAGSLFSYSDINKELQELNDDAIELYKVTDFESTSKIKDVQGWYALQQSEKCTIEEGANLWVLVA